MLSAKGQGQQAEFLFECGLELAREQLNQKTEGECLYSLSHTAILLGDPHRALIRAEQAREIFRARTDCIGEASVATLLAAAHTLLGHFKQAEKLHQSGILLARAWQVPLIEAAHLANLGILRTRELAQQEQGLADLYRALALFQEQADAEGAAQTLKLLASVALGRQQQEEALEYLQQALGLAPGLKGLRVRIHFLLGEVYASLGLKEESLRHRGRAFACLFPSKASLFEMLFEDHEVALAEARARGDKREEAGQLLFLARRQADAPDLRGYLALFEQALALYRELGDLERLSAQLVELGRGLALFRPGRVRDKRARALGYWRAGRAFRRQYEENREITELDRVFSFLYPASLSNNDEEEEFQRALVRWGEKAFQRAWRASEEYYTTYMASLAPRKQ